jgi:hypothetical protein
LLGTFQARETGVEAAFRYAFDQPQIVVSMVLCGILGWGNSPVSNTYVRAAAFTVTLLLIIPETGVELTFNTYDVRTFYQLRDPVFGISVLLSLFTPCCLFYSSCILRILL